jgi:hypothetical protein
MTMLLRSLLHRLAILSCLTGIGCKSAAPKIVIPEDQLAAKSPEKFISQFEGTELAKCIDENGKPTGHLKAIWRLKNSANQELKPFIQGFGGKVRTLGGVLIEFQSLSAREENRINIPSISNSPDFPRGSYSAFVLRFLVEESKSGIAVLKANGKKIEHDDFAKAVLFVPRFALGSEYSTKYYFMMPNEKIHELSCQAVSDDIRAALNTFSMKDGLHDFSGPRGKRLPLTASLPSQKVLDPKQSASINPALNSVLPPIDLAATSKKDLRPVKRAKNYDELFRHERMYECEKDGALDAIWRIADDKGKPLPRELQFITGFAADLQEKTSARKISVNAVSVDPAPAFYSGRMPPDGRYFFPSIEFNEEDFKKNNALHSPLGAIDVGFMSGGGTVFIPRDGSAQPISVSLSMGKSLRGNAYQITAKCKPVRNNISVWMNYCLGQDNRKNSGNSCQP